MKYKLILTGCLLWSFQVLSAQHDRKIQFPNIEGYYTLKCDFHQHTVFSDGSVWPDIRVQEAVKDGLDAISITDHLEYQPHKKDIPHPDRNRSYEIAKNAAKNTDLLVIHGAEVTRSMPPGHANALFIKDANKLLIKDAMKVFEEANKQGAFVFWNHPNWTSQQKDGIATLSEMHKELIEKGWLHGIEVVNELTYSDEALDIALQNDLAIMGTSDVHGLIDWLYDVPHGHRPVTLVFAREKTEEAIKKALFARQTVVWFDNMLIGEEEYLIPLIESSIKVEKVAYQGKSSVVSVTVTNQSDASFILENLTDYTFHTFGDVVILKAHQTLVFEVKTVERLTEFDLKFKVLNALSAPKSHPEISWDIKTR